MTYVHNKNASHGENNNNNKKAWVINFFLDICIPSHFCPINYYSENSAVIQLSPGLIHLALKFNNGLTDGPRLRYDVHLFRPDFENHISLTNHSIWMGMTNLLVGNSFSRLFSGEGKIHPFYIWKARLLQVW